ncbi:MAG: hypothetical protein JWQ27_2581 [Ferruginibacter sp.]|nr:hypothetical protein [Ferruginibacter sp.]
MDFTNTPIDILIVEDNMGDVFLLKESLRSTSVNIGDITHAPSLQAAIDLIAEEKPSIIFLDLSLPDKWGLETFLTMQLHSSQVPIVILTGLDDTQLALEAITKGAQDFLVKGDVDDKLLTKTILYSIERKRIAESLQLSNERYNLVSFATNDMVWDWDLTNNTVFRSKSGWAKLFGDEASGETRFPDSWWERVHPDDKDNTNAVIQEVLDNPGINNFEIECRIDTGNGEYADIVDRGYAIRNDAGTAIRLIGATQNVTEKKRAQEELKRLSLIAKETQNAVIVTDTEGRIQWTNEAFHGITGYALDETIGRKPGDFLQGEETNPVIKRYMRLKIRTVKPFACDVINYKKNGQRYWIRIQCQPQFDEKGKHTSFFAMQTDITREKDAEERLVTSEQRFRSIIEKSNEGLSLIDAEGTVLDISPAGKKILGYTPDGFMGYASDNLVYPEDVEMVNAAFAQVLSAYNNSTIIEYRYKRKNGNYIWLESTFHNLLHEPAIRAVVIHFRDVSSRRVFEDVLKNSEEKYRSLFNVNPSSIFIWDPKTYAIIEVNDAAEKDYGYERAELLKLNMTDLLRYKNNADFRKLAGKVLEDEHHKSSGIWQHERKDGTYAFMDITYQAIDYYGKKACISIITNITDKVVLEKKLAEERLKKQHEITAAVITAQEQERGDIGKELHDNINQILATTKLYIEYAITNDEMRPALLEGARDFISSAVKEIRSLSKALSPPSLGEVGLLMALNELVESIKVVNKFTFHTSWDDLDEDLLSEELKLTIFRIIQEQLNNIIKHANANNIWIKIKTRNNRLMIDVKDDGIGFNMINKSDGVGLKNITSRAALHNGTMQMKSEEGNGCELSLLFNL